MTQQNTDLIKKLFHSPFDEKSIATYDQLFSEDIVLHGPQTSHQAQGLKRLKEIDKELSNSFKKPIRTINEIFAIKDKVVVYWAVHGMGGIDKNSNKKVVVSGHGIYRVRALKICEIWQSWDKISLINPLTKTEELSTKTDLLLKSFGRDLYFAKASLLSLRERECMKLLLQGKTAKETAMILSLSHRTIESYFENIKDKVKCDSKRDLFTIAQVFDQLAIL